jgi:hypothetical protein
MGARKFSFKQTNIPTTGSGIDNLKIVATNKLNIIDEITVNICYEIDELL